MEIDINLLTAMAREAGNAISFLYNKESLLNGSFLCLYQ